MYQNTLPMWKGFNLLDMLNLDRKGEFSETDFKWIAELGFNFVRLPLSYQFWINNNDVYDVNAENLKKIDRAVEFGDKYGIHVNLNFHKAPGYNVGNYVTEPYSLWKDAEAIKAFCFHWELMARRYKGIASKKLSFNPLNEPPSIKPDNMTAEAHTKAITACVNTIRNVDKDRLIIVDGVRYATQSCPELIGLGVAQSCHAYYPMEITHYKAAGFGEREWIVPTWPMHSDFGGFQHGWWDKDRIKEFYREWGELVRQGVGVHCGESGISPHTPHNVALAWLKDVIEELDRYKIGLALWVFKGPGAILDSERDDVDYENFHGHKLDRKLLDLILR